MTERSNVEEALRRRLRPWWGKAPGTLIARWVVQGAISGLLAYGCIRGLEMGRRQQARRQGHMSVQPLRLIRSQ